MANYRQIDFLLNPWIQNGIVLLGTAEFYEAGTTTPLNVFTDNVGSGPASVRSFNANGVIEAFVDENTSFKVIIKDTDTSVIETFDNLLLTSSVDELDSSFYKRDGSLPLTGHLSGGGYNLEDLGNLKLRNNRALLAEHGQDATWHHADDLAILAKTNGQWALRGLDSGTDFGIFKDNVQIARFSTSGTTLVGGITSDGTLDVSSLVVDNIKLGNIYDQDIVITSTDPNIGLTDGTESYVMGITGGFFEILDQDNSKYVMYYNPTTGKTTFGSKTQTTYDYYFDGFLTVAGTKALNIESTNGNSLLQLTNTGGTNSTLKIATSTDDIMTMDKSKVVFGNTGSSLSKPNILIGAGFGTKDLPEYTYYSDLNTGMYHPALDQLGLTAGGVEKVKLTTGKVTVDEELEILGASTPKLTINNGTDSFAVSISADHLLISGDNDIIKVENAKTTMLTKLDVNDETVLKVESYVTNGGTTSAPTDLSAPGTVSDGRITHKLYVDNTGANILGTAWNARPANLDTIQAISDSLNDSATIDARITTNANDITTNVGNINQKYDKTGGIITGNVDINNNDILNGGTINTNIIDFGSGGEIQVSSGIVKMISTNTQALDMGGKRIVFVNTPISTQDAANKAYVDDEIDTAVNKTNSYWTESSTTSAVFNGGQVYNHGHNSMLDNTRLCRVIVSGKVEPALAAFENIELIVPLNYDGTSFASGITTQTMLVNAGNHVLVTILTNSVQISTVGYLIGATISVTVRSIHQVPN